MFTIAIVLILVCIAVGWAIKGAKPVTAASVVDDAKAGAAALESDAKTVAQDVAKKV